MRNIQMIFLFVLGLIMSANTFATLLEINASSSGTITGSGPGSLRGIGFLANSAFSISNVGLYSDIGSTSYDINIYSSSNGSDITGLLASTSATVGGAGLQWYDVALSFSFLTSNFYAIEWATTSGSTIPGGSGSYFHYAFDSNLPLTTGPVTLLDGFASSSGFSNLLHPLLRVNVVESVPEPVTLVLMSLGLAGLGFSRKRKAA